MNALSSVVAFASIRVARTRRVRLTALASGVFVAFFVLAGFPLDEVRAAADITATGASSANSAAVDLFPDQRGRRPIPIAADQAQALTATTAGEPPLTAPRFPLRLLGAWWESDQRTLVLGADGGDGIVLACGACANPRALRVGGLVVGNWRLERIEPDRMVFTYLPLHIEQLLPLDELARKPTP